MPSGYTNSASRPLTCVTRWLPPCTPVFVFPPIGTQLFPEICEGDCFEVADTLVCDAGNYTFTLQAANGCDSVIQVQVSVLPEVSSSYSALICDSDSLLVGDTWYFPPGQYAEMQTSYNGCDSIINLTLNAIICEITGNTQVQHILCHGDLSGQITFSVVDGTPPFTYTWQQLDGSPSGSGSLSDINTPETISNLPPGGYLIGVQDPFGNDVILTANIFEPPALSLEFETRISMDTSLLRRRPRTALRPPFPEVERPVHLRMEQRQRPIRHQRPACGRVRADDHRCRGLHLDGRDRPDRASSARPRGPVRRPRMRWVRQRQRLGTFGERRGPAL